VTSAYRFDLPTRTKDERNFLDALETAAQNSKTTNVERFANFPLWAPRQNVARFLAQWHIYQKIVGIHGSIIECGVAFGGGLMAWAHFASILEPVNHTRRVIGFDTFQGFPGMSTQDEKAQSGLAYKGGMSAPVDEEIAALAQIHDLNRAVGHIPRVELVKGDACQTIPKYIQDNPHLLVALLVLDFDIYEPTWKALDKFIPLMPKGAVIVWDELNCKDWPGETKASLPFLRRVGRLKRLPYASTISFAVIE
jgi:macrocin-O-methyltransferase TylF-like protien